MLELVMWMNKRRLMLVLLIAAIVAMVLLAVLYPRTHLYLRLVEPSGDSAVAYRVNTRGTVTVLWEEGDRYGSRTVRLPKEAWQQLQAATAALPQAAHARDTDQAVLLEVSGNVLRDDANGVAGPPVEPLLDILLPYVQ